MDKYGIVLFVVVIYCAVVTGVFIKFKSKGVKTTPLFLSIIIPVLLLFVTFQRIINILNGSEESLWQKTRHIYKLLFVTFLMFPTLIGLIGIKLATFERSLTYQKNTSREIKIVKDFFPECYGDLLGF